MAGFVRGTMAERRRDALKSHMPMPYTNRTHVPPPPSPQLPTTTPPFNTRGAGRRAGGEHRGARPGAWQCVALEVMQLLDVQQPPAELPGQATGSTGVAQTKPNQAVHRTGTQQPHSDPPPPGPWETAAGQIGEHRGKRQVPVRTSQRVRRLETNIWTGLD